MDTGQLAHSDTIHLLPALLEARKAIAPAHKGGTNTFDRYNYATLEDWHRAVMPALLANGLVLTISTVGVSQLEPRQTKKGGIEYVVQVECIARLWHLSGEWLEIRGAGQGQDRADKALYKAVTGASKYLYAQMFALPTTDDPEGDPTVGESEGTPKKKQSVKQKEQSAKPPADPQTAAIAKADKRMAEAASYHEWSNMWAGIVDYFDKQGWKVPTDLLQRANARMAELVEAAIPDCSDGDDVGILKSFVDAWAFTQPVKDGLYQKLLAKKESL